MVTEHPESEDCLLLLFDPDSAFMSLTFKAEFLRKILTQISLST